jgi:hypothetical protein
VERRLAVHAGAHRKALTLAIVLASVPVSAAPKAGQARKLFDRGVAAYAKGDYAAASAALSESYQREGDPETLFAWAQSERKQGKCASALPLYETLLAFELPPENAKVVQTQLAECKQIIASTPKPVEPPPKAAEPPPKPAEPLPRPAEPLPRPAEVTASAPEGLAWWRDPVGDVLVGSGVVALGVGAALLVSARSADLDSVHATSYADFKAREDRAHDQGMFGVIAVAAGSGLAIAGVVRYVMHRDSEHAMVTGWLAPAGGGAAISAHF